MALKDTCSELLIWVPEQEMAVAPAVFLAEALVDDLQIRRAEPVSDLGATRVVVVTGDVAVNDFAAPGRLSPPRQRRKRLLDDRLGNFLDGQVQQAAWPRRATQVRQYQRPVSGGTFSMASMVMTASNSASYGSS